MKTDKFTCHLQVINESNKAWQPFAKWQKTDAENALCENFCCNYGTISFDPAFCSQYWLLAVEVKHNIFELHLF